VIGGFLFVKRSDIRHQTSDPEKNPKRDPEQKRGNMRGKEPLTEERRIYRSLV
jgi:hypothetical protein